MKKKLVEAAWSDYRQRALDPIHGIGVTQLRETRRAFYAGASGLFAAIMNILEPGTEATEADLAVMDDIYAEFTAFSEAIKQGKA